MNTNFLHQANKPAVAGDDLTQERPPPTSSRACCCAARPVVTVMMPASATRPYRVDLLLCGHHYRVSMQALADANATVVALTEMTGARPPALLPDLPGPRVSAG